MLQIARTVHAEVPGDTEPAEVSNGMKSQGTLGPVGSGRLPENKRKMRREGRRKGTDHIKSRQTPNLAGGESIMAMLVRATFPVQL